MGERLRIWWEVMENTWIPATALLFKGALLILLTWFVLGTDTPWYKPLPLHEYILVKTGLILFFLGYSYPELKKIYSYYKNTFMELRGKK